MDELFVCTCGRLHFEVCFPLGATRLDGKADERRKKGDRRRSVGQIILVCKNCTQRVTIENDNMGGVFLERPGDVDR